MIMYIAAGYEHNHLINQLLTNNEYQPMALPIRNHSLALTLQLNFLPVQLSEIVCIPFV